MTRLPPRPDLSWKEDGTPVDERVGDVYFSRHNGLEETRAVFLKGCGLPERWHDRASFTIAELGFGTGLNFLAAWLLWRETRPSGAWLHFVSFEGYPLDRQDAARALSAWPELGELSALLAAQWPERAKGVQRMAWPSERVTLTLHLGEISQTLAQARLKADAWFLDGFSPARNEALWAPSLWEHVAHRCRAGARLATFTVAGAVRRGLTDAGFDVRKEPGFGRKRERLEVRFTGPETSPPDTYGLRPSTAAPVRARIVGAGIAGACAARTLLDRGIEVQVIDTAPSPASGASGNRLALVMPRLDAGDTVQARLLIDAYLAARGFYAGRTGVSETEVAQHPKDEREMDRIAKVLADPPLGLENLEALSGGGLLHKRALILEPEILIPALLDGAVMRYSATVTSDDLADDTPTIIAAGHRVTELLPWLRIEGRLGQVEAIESAAHAPSSALASGDYAVASGRHRLWGATFERWDGETIKLSEAARAENMKTLGRLAPYWQHEARSAAIASRAGVRATTPDRLPLIGAVPDAAKAQDVFQGVRYGQTAGADAPLMDNLYIAGGFGSRGFTWGPWAGEILAAQLLGEPAPASEDALRAVSPMRQILRDLKRSS